MIGKRHTKQRGQFRSFAQSVVSVSIGCRNRFGCCGTMSIPSIDRSRKGTGLHRTQIVDIAGMLCGERVRHRTRKLPLGWFQRRAKTASQRRRQKRLTTIRSQKLTFLHPLRPYEGVPWQTRDISTLSLGVAVASLASKKPDSD